MEADAPALVLNETCHPCLMHCAAGDGSRAPKRKHTEFVCAHRSTGLRRGCACRRCGPLSYMELYTKYASRLGEAY